MSYPEISLEATNKLEHYWAMYLAKKLTGPQITFLFILIYQKVWPQKNWIQYDKALLCKRKTTEYLQDFEYALFKHDPDFYKIQGLEKIPLDCTIEDLIFCSRLKGVKQIAIIALQMWIEKKLELAVYDFILDPADVLRLQSQGKRCVSLLRRPRELNTLFEHQRNCFQFLIHDLEHAWQMFHDKNLMNLQIRLSQKLKKLYEENNLDFLKRDSSCKKDLDYILSDMNTHPDHTRLALKSLVLKFYKTTIGKNLLDKSLLDKGSLITNLIKNPDHKLDADLEKKFLAHWHEIESYLLYK